MKGMLVRRDPGKGSGKPAAATDLTGIGLPDRETDRTTDLNRSADRENASRKFLKGQPADQKERSDCKEGATEKCFPRHADR